MSYQSSGPSKPQPIPGAQTTPPPRRQSFFDWAMSFGSPGAGATSNNNNNLRPSNSIIEQAQAKQRRSSSFDSSNCPSGVSTSPRSAHAKPRTFSQSMISHDEALNLSRAGAGLAAAPNAPRRRESTSRHQRRNSKGNYEGLGLVAAFSGGPSSF